MKDALKIICKSNIYLYSSLTKLKNIFIRFKHRNDIKIISKSTLISIKKDCIGNDNLMIIEPECIIKPLTIHVRGNNNRINIGAHCYIGDECSLWIEGNNCIISIGESTTMTCKCHINVQEDNQSIIINRDCMFSNNIIVRTSDSHPIYDNITHQRINNAKSIEIGEHVWVAPNSKIMKGAIIGNGAIIGSDTTISHKIPNNALAVGRPAKIVKTDLSWTREKLF